MGKSEELKRLLEMARLGLDKELDYRIYPEPLGNPSFHIVSSEFEIVVTIEELKILEIKTKGKSKFKFKKGDFLSGELLKRIISFMGTVVPHTKLTRKLYMVVLWNDQNPKYLIKPSDIKW